MNNENYILITGWMANELDLKGSELFVYALIYGFSQDGESKFYGSRKYIADWFNCSLPIIDKALKKVYGSDYELGEKDFPTITWNGGPVYGQEVVAYLKQFKGMGYRLGCHWDGEIPYSPASCIGAIVGAYKHFGIKIECTEDTSVFLNNPSKYTVVTNEPHHPGDIVIYEGHYAMLTGEGNQIIHSTSSENGIIISNDYRKSGQGLLGIVRVNGVL